MARRLFVLITFITIGFIAGMVLTGRMRSADEAAAAMQQTDRAADANRVSGLVLSSRRTAMS